MFFKIIFVVFCIASILLFDIVSKKFSLLVMYFFFEIYKTEYMINPVRIVDTIIPTTPKFPNILKKTYISLPDANPAPIMVPINIEITFIT